MKREKLDIVDATSSPIGSYSVTEGEATSSFGPATPAVPDRLYLVAASGVAAFRPVYDGLSSMGFYNLNPRDHARRPEPRLGGPAAPDRRQHRERGSGGSAATTPTRRSGSSAYLAAIVPGIEAV